MSDGRSRTARIGIQGDLVGELAEGSSGDAELAGGAEATRVGSDRGFAGQDVISRTRVVSENRPSVFTRTM